MSALASYHQTSNSVTTIQIKTTALLGPWKFPHAPASPWPVPSPLQKVIGLLAFTIITLCKHI